MAWNLNDDKEAEISSAGTPVPERPNTIFEEPEAKPIPEVERIIRLEKKLNGVLYLLQKAEASRRARGGFALVVFLIGVLAVGYSFWPQLRDADWGAVRDTAYDAGKAFQDRRLGDFLSERFGDTTLGQFITTVVTPRENRLSSPVISPTEPQMTVTSSVAPSVVPPRPRHILVP